jgi:lipoprotein-anchoring transpeptidase ErfK/SrfK
MSLQSTQRTPTETQRNRMLQPSPRRDRDQRKEWDWDRQTVILGLLLLLVLAALSMASVWLYASTRVMSGVVVLGVPVGGKSRARAAALLQEAWQTWTIDVEDGEQRWAVSAPQLGLILDVEATVDAALSAGSLLARLRGVLQSVEQVQVQPVVTIEPTVARRYLESLAPDLAVLPGDASLRVVAGRVEIVEAVPGRELDVTATVDWLAANRRQAAAHRRLPLVFLSVPPVVVDVSPFVAQLEAWLANPVAIHAYDPITDESFWWSAPPDVWGTWLLLSIDPEHPDALDWKLDRAQVRAYLEGHAGALAPDRYVELDAAVDDVEMAIGSMSWSVSMRVYHSAGRHVVQLGETLASIARNHGFPYPWLQQANPGVEALRPDQVISIPSPDVLLPLPVVPGKRLVVSISQQRMWAYQWGELLWAWTVSTGIESSPTSPGVFQVQSHEMNAYAASWDLWMPYFLGIYRPVPVSDFMNGFHGFPTRDGVNLLWTGNLGYPVTYGCILLSTQNAAALYEWAEEGVVVEIVQ